MSFREKLLRYASADSVEEHVWDAMFLWGRKLKTLPYSKFKVLAWGEEIGGIHPRPRLQQYGFYWTVEFPEKVRAQGTVEIKVPPFQEGMEDLSPYIKEAILDPGSRWHPWPKGLSKVPEDVLEYVESKTDVLRIEASAPWLDEDPDLPEYPSVETDFNQWCQVFDVKVSVKRTSPLAYKATYTATFYVSVTDTDLA